jgi:hypothetical protein
MSKYLLASLAILLSCGQVTQAMEQKPKAPKQQEQQQVPLLESEIAYAIKNYTLKKHDEFEKYLNTCDAQTLAHGVLSARRYINAMGGLKMFFMLFQLLLKRMVQGGCSWGDFERKLDGMRFFEKFAQFQKITVVVDPVRRANVSLQQWDRLCSTEKECENFQPENFSFDVRRPRYSRVILIENEQGFWIDAIYKDGNWYDKRKWLGTAPDVFKNPEFLELNLGRKIFTKQYIQQQSGEFPKETIVTLWDAQRAECLQVFKVPGSASIMVLSPSERYVIIGGRSWSGFALGDVATGNYLQVFEQPEVDEVFFSHDEKYLLSRSWEQFGRFSDVPVGSVGGHMRLWQIPTIIHAKPLAEHAVQRALPLFSQFKHLQESSCAICLTNDELEKNLGELKLPVGFGKIERAGNLIVLGCNKENKPHPYCLDCLKLWLNTSREEHKKESFLCPLCRTEWSTEKVFEKL